MKKLALIVIAIVAVMFGFYFQKKTDHEVVRVGLVIPVQNASLDDIVDGFRLELTARLAPRKVAVEVQNALGDINLQKSACNKFINAKVDLLVPIGKGATLMAMNLAPSTQPILFLAAFLPPDSALAKQRDGLMGVIDEIPVAKQLDVMRAAIPNLTKLTVVFSSADKVFDDVKDLELHAKEQGISVQQLMVQNLSELYTVSSRIESDSQAIFILKDVLVASGVSALVQQATARKIPLVTSDEGTIKNGGTFAVGVSEAEIGRQGARMAADFIDKKEFLHIQYLDHISVFINKAASIAQGLDVKRIEEFARAAKLDVVEI